MSLLKSEREKDVQLLNKEYQRLRAIVKQQNELKITQNDLKSTIDNRSLNSSNYSFFLEPKEPRG
jgi:hypothetical protein